MSRPHLVGLTGGIGSGKSTVGAEFTRLGAVVIDADRIAKSLTAAGGAALPALRDAFGEACLAADGSMDRRWMRERVFQDADARRLLEAIVHPLVQQQMQAEADAAPAGATVVHEVPLLAESGHWRPRLNRVLVVDCDEAVQLERVQQRPGWSADTARRVIAQQAPRAQRRAVADAVIDNSRMTRAELACAVDAVWSAWRCR